MFLEWICSLSSLRSRADYLRPASARSGTGVPACRIAQSTLSLSTLLETFLHAVQQVDVAAACGTKIAPAHHMRSRHPPPPPHMLTSFTCTGCCCVGVCRWDLKRSCCWSGMGLRTRTTRSLSRSSSHFCIDWSAARCVAGVVQLMCAHLYSGGAVVCWHICSVEE